MNTGKKDWIESLKEIPGYLRGMIGFITVVVGFVLFIRENFYLNLVVTIFITALAFILFCVYVLSKKTKPLIEGGRGVYVYEKQRPWAIGGIVLVLGGFVLSIFQPGTIRYINLAFSESDKVVPTVAVSPVSAPMVKIEGGKFIMGNNDLKDSYPERTVSIHSFWMDVYEVTNEDYAVFLKSEDHSPPEHWRDGKYRFGKDKHPVAGVTWHDAVRYCEFVNKRLPTEAEWEKAARGINGNIWPWGNDWDSSKANVRETGIGDTTSVGSYPEGNSDFGVADMAGNVMEWVDDWYQEDYFTIAPLSDPIGPPGPPINNNKILRGGAWYDEKEISRTFVRLGIYPPEFPFKTNMILDAPFAYTGFRCACNECQP